LLFWECKNKAKSIDSKFFMEYFSPMISPAALQYHGVGTTSSRAACCFMI